MGTVFSFHVYRGTLAEAEVREAVAAGCRRLHEIDAVFSTWRPESPLSRLRSGELQLEDAPPVIDLVVELCREARDLSDGWFDPWAMPGGFDPTGLVKGWAVEEAAGVLRDAGIDAALVNGGGDIALLGRPPDADAWQVGIRHPWRADSLACVIDARNAVATSGSYERGLHLINPKDRTPATANASATVTGPRLAIADALATALAVGGGDVLAIIDTMPDFEGYLIGSEGSETATGGFARR